MRDDLQQELYEKFPKIFVRKDWDKTKSAMCWGIDCPDEWFRIIKALCENIQNHIDNKGMPQIEATQVKEKFGTFCFYYEPKHPYADGAISLASSLVLNKDMWEDFEFL